MIVVNVVGFDIPFGIIQAKRHITTLFDDMRQQLTGV
jgi:hypothetical protein